MVLHPGLQIITDNLQMNLGVILTIILNAGVFACFYSIDFKIGTIIGMVGNGLLFLFTWHFYELYGIVYSIPLIMMIVYLIMLVFTLLAGSQTTTQLQ